MPLKDNYELQVGDLVQHVSYDGLSEGQIGVVIGSEHQLTGYGARRRRGLVFLVRFPSQTLSIKPRYLRVIKKVDKNT
jgi:hypothetical protein